MQLYKLELEYREYVWGGQRIQPNVGKTAEAWLVYENYTIMEGPLKGISLSGAAAQEGEALLGGPVMEKTGKRFLPLACGCEGGAGGCEGGAGGCETSNSEMVLIWQDENG